MSRIKFMNISVDNLTMEEAISKIDSLIQLNVPSYVVTPNVDHIVRLESDTNLKKSYENADLILTDGKPLIWISKFYKKPIKEKISGSDLFPEVCKLASRKGYSLYFLGAQKGVAEKAAKNLKNKYCNLKISGYYSPPVGFENDEDELRYIISDIKLKKPSILIVALGCPKQEIFMNNYCNDLGVPISFGLGATLDFEAGNIKRAPRWMSNNGLEWLYRITQDPKRLIKRYLIDDLKIIKYIFKYRKVDREKI